MVKSNVGYGFIAESDYLSLSADINICNEKLIDEGTGVEHLLNPKALESVYFLKNKHTLKEWQSYGASLNITLKNMNEIFEFLNNIAAFKIERSLKSKLKYLTKVIYCTFLGIPPLKIAIRRKLNTLNVIFAVIQSSNILFTSLLFLNLLIIVSGLGLQHNLQLSLIFFLIVISSLCTHELAHAIQLNKLKAKGIIVQKGVRLGIVHKSLKHGNEVKVAIIGPIAGIVTSLSIGNLINAFSSSYSAIQISIIVSLFHLVSFMPSFGDGKAIFNSKGVNSNV